MSDTLEQALVAAQTEMPVVEKSKVVQVKTDKGTFSYAYATLDHLIALTRPVLNKHGLAITQFPVVTETGIGLRTTLTHVSGESLSSVMPLTAPGRTMQELGSAITYARRYAWAAALGIAAEEDDDAGKVSRGADGDSASGNGAGSSLSPGSPAPHTPGPDAGEGGAGPGSPFQPPAGATKEPNASEPPDDGGDVASVLLTFGKHKGKRVRDVPEAYLRWWVQQDEPKTADLRRQRAAVNMFLNGPQPSEFSDETIPF